MSAGRAIARVVVGADVVRAATTWERRADQYFHRSTSAFALVAVTQALGWFVMRSAAAGMVGWVFGGGRWSPDQDQYGGWRRIAELPRRLAQSAFLPVRPIGWALERANRAVGYPLNHHRVTHSVTIHAGLIALAWVYLPARCPLWLIPAAWLAHDLGDALVGKPYQGEAGPAWVLWWCRWGLGWFKSGGLVGKLLTAAAVAGTVWLLVLA